MLPYQSVSAGQDPVIIGDSDSPYRHQIAEESNPKERIHRLPRLDSNINLDPISGSRNGRPTDLPSRNYHSTLSDRERRSPRLSPKQKRASLRRSGSDAGSFSAHPHGSVRSDQRPGNLSPSQTQKSSVKRTGDEMRGVQPHPESRPTKLPFSPSPSHQAPTSHETSPQDYYGQSRSHNAYDITSPNPTASGIAGRPRHLYHTPSHSQDANRSSLVALQSSPSNQVLEMMKQPATRPITEQQLINEVKGIYAGLVMVEKKCVEIVAQQSSSNKHLSDQQWKALVALHRTLLQEHHDFFSASQHPTASDTLKKLAIKYAMPARMWRHGIHAFLELLRHRLPDSMEHMLSFIYLAYSMMALLKESVPGFVETWIECLGDLARYRMAIEDSDPRDREIWSNVAKMWYNEAADRSPNVGRIQHHLAVLARPNIVEQNFYYDKALVSVVPFVNARESIMLLFDMFLKEKSDAVQDRYPAAEYAFVNTYARLFTRRDPAVCQNMLELFKTSFGGHIDRAGARFKMQGSQMASCLFAGYLDFGKEDAYLWQSCCQLLKSLDARRNIREGNIEKHLQTDAQYLRSLHRKYWSELQYDTPVKRVPLPQRNQDKDTLETSEAVVGYAAQLASETITLVASRLGDKNGVQFMHVILANLWGLSFVADALPYIEASIPWVAIIAFLNTIGRSGVSLLNVESDVFPPSHGGHGRQLPEDFLMRGMITTYFYYEPDFFSGQLVDEDERTIELPSHQAPRAERCLWLGVRLAKLGRYITYDTDTKMFDTTPFARSLSASYV